MTKDPLTTSLTDALATGAEAGLPVPDTATPMVSRSLRLPLEVDQAVRVAAEARGLPATTLMREFIEAGLAELTEDTALVPLAEVRRVLATLAARHPAA
jgi:predicted DNA-binding protein